MKKIIAAGATDQSLDVFIQDSSSTTGAGLTGLVYNSASLVCYYRKGATGSATALTLATQTVGGAHSDGGFVEIDGTNMPGMYRLDLSDTMVASEGSVSIILKGATNMAPVTIELQVVSATRGLAGTALPAAAADAAGGLPISDAGGLDLDTLLGRITANVATASALATVDSNVDAILVDTGTTLPAQITALNDPTAAAIADAVWDEATAGHTTAGTFGEQLKTDVDAILTDTGTTLPAQISGLNDPTAAAIADAVWDEATAGHTTAGTFGEQLKTDVDAILVDTADMQPKLGTPAADLAADIAAIQTDTGTTLPAQISGLNDPTAAAIADAVWDEVITGAQHNVNTSAAKYLRQASAAITGVTGTLQSATSTTAVLASGGVTADDILNGERISIIDGTGVGQSRLIVDSVASTDTVTVASAWTTTPDNTSIYAVVGAEVDLRSVAGQAVAATGSVDFDDLAAIEVDTQDIQSRIPAALSGGNMKADVLALNGDATSAANLERSASTIVRGTVSHDNTVATTTVFYADDITEATADHFNGRTVIFTSGAVADQASAITDYALEAGEGKFTVTALTEAPADNVTFVIV